jgi:hypothetical protein
MKTKIKLMIRKVTINYSHYNYTHVSIFIFQNNIRQIRIQKTNKQILS